MNVIFVSPHFPPNYLNFSRALKRAGANALGIGDAPFEQLPPDLKDSLTEYYYLPDMTHYDALLRAVAYFIYKYGKIDRLESMNEFWLGSDAQLREDFNIFGQKPADLAFNRRKMGMKKVFINAGIPCAAGLMCDDPEAVREFAAREKFPLFLKPDIGVGASGAFKVSTMDQLNEALANLPEGYLVEKALTGELMSFDGLTNREGEIIFRTAHHFSAGIMETVQQSLPLHYYSLRRIPAELERLGRLAVKAFNIRERFFHIEFFRGEKSDFTVLEVNVRPPGGYTVDMMNIAGDIDLYQWWADLIAGKPRDFACEHPYCAAHSSRRWGVNYHFSHEDILERLRQLVVYHMEMPRAFAKVMGDYVYLLRAPDVDILRTAIADVERPA